jgi:tetratricopeptide (TPR) repeat protein
MGIYKKSIKHFSLSKEGVAVKLNRPGEKRDNSTLPDKLLTAKEINNKADSDYRVFTYNITRNDKAKIGINEAIKKYEDATIKNPYDNNAFLNLAHAYYCKAMYLDDAIARREDAPEGNQNVSVKRYYLNDDAGSGKNSETGFAEQTNTFGNNIAFRNRSGNMYEEMFREAIIEYKNALRINPNSSNSLYGLAFSFSTKGSSPGVALKSKNNSEGILFGY